MPGTRRAECADADGHRPARTDSCPDGRANRHAHAHADPDRRLSATERRADATFSKTKYPGIRRHVQRAIRKGWPAVPVLNRDGATERKPRGWKADIAYVRSSENRSHAAALGDRLEPFCDGTRFQYRFK